MRFTFLAALALVGCAPMAEPEILRPASEAPPPILCAYAFEAPEPTAGTLEHPENERDCTLPDGSDEFSVGFHNGPWLFKVHLPRTRNGQWTDSSTGLRAVARVADVWCSEWAGTARAAEKDGRWRLDLDLSCSTNPAIALRGTLTSQ